MTLPKDPQKREAYLEKQRQSTAARWANPEFRTDVLQKREKANKSPETRERRSNAAKWRYANPDNAEKNQADQEARIAALRSAEARARTSAAQKKRFSDPANAERNALEKEKRRQAMQRPEVGAAISKAAKERASDPEYRATMSVRAKEAMNRPEVQEKCSESRKAVWQRPEARANYQKGFEERWSRPEEHEKTSEATKAAMQEVVARPEYRETMRKAGLRFWSDPERRANQLALMQAGRTPENLQKWARAMRLRERTSIEIMIAQVLDTLGIEYQEQLRIGRYVADFYIPSKNLVVECDGFYWHEKMAGAKEKGERKNAFILSQGYALVRLPEFSIRAGELELLYNALAD